MRDPSVDWSGGLEFIGGWLSLQILPTAELCTASGDGVD